MDVISKKLIPDLVLRYEANPKLIGYAIDIKSNKLSVFMKNLDRFDMLYFQESLPHPCTYMIKGHDEEVVIMLKPEVK